MSKQDCLEIGFIGYSFQPGTIRRVGNATVKVNRYNELYPAEAEYTVVGAGHRVVLRGEIMRFHAAGLAAALGGVSC